VALEHQEPWLLCSHASFLFEQQHMWLSKEGALSPQVAIILPVAMAIGSLILYGFVVVFACRPCFCFPFVVFPIFPMHTMKLDTAAKAFSDGIVGSSGVVQDLCLPA
jgi:hypothetical protein